MLLKKISLSSFRNFGAAEVVPGPRFNVFHGRNGQGKSNILEAIFLASTLKSFRAAKNEDLVGWGCDFAVVRSEVERHGTAREIAVLVEPRGKKARVDRKPLEKLSDFFGLFNVVVFAPDDLAVTRGAPELRRRYLDRAVFSANAGYLADHHAYMKTLRQRNALLKRGERDGLDIWSERLAEAAVPVFTARTRYLDAVSELVGSFHCSIAGAGKQPSLSYRPHRLAPVSGPSGYRERLAEALSSSVSEELRRGVTLFGPHRDDVEMRLDGKGVKEYASQGEQRTFVLALKMAEIEHLRLTHGASPVLLLDDMTSELDAVRNRNLMNFLEEREMQVFITTTALENLRITDKAKYRTFHVQDGSIR